MRGDEHRLRQIVFNLVANAVKFTVRGGVVFSVRRGLGSTILFSVSDTGPGISAEHFSVIFEPFTQLRESGAAATGTGLGLSISRSLVEKMGGKLEVESRPGWGTRFFFAIELPVSTTDVVTPDLPTKRVIGYSGPRQRVLVVDDNAANRGVIVGMLAPLGFDLAESATGEDSLALATTFRPHLVLMDLRLPGIDGQETTRRWRSLGAVPATKIIAVSASAYDLDQRECFIAGCDDFLAKPFREEALWASVGRVLQLEWVYGDELNRAASATTEIQPPAPADSDALYELASKGDVVGLRARAQALAESDPRLTPFANGVLELAARFKMKAVRHFIDRHRSSSPHA